MNAEASHAVPFVAINACLREDFLQRVLSRVLEFLPHASSPGVPTLTKALPSIPIPGFRQFQRAPRGLQARAAISRFRSSGEFVGSALEVWMEAESALAGYLETFLEGQGIPRQRLSAEDGHFRSYWSLDEVLRLADLFCADHEGADRDSAALLMCCLTSRAPLAEGPSGEGAPAEGAAKAAEPAPAEVTASSPAASTVAQPAETPAEQPKQSRRKTPQPSSKRGAQPPK
jgi:hypothetical protein